MADKSLILVFAAATVAVAAGVRGVDSLSEAARRAGIEPETVAAQGDQGDQGIALGSDARTGAPVVAVFRRAQDGSWAIGRKWLLCGGQEAAPPGAPAAPPEKPASPPATPPAPAPLPAAAPSAAPSPGPVAMPPPRSLSDGFVRSIQDDLRRRARQSAAGDAEKARRNAASLRDLVQDVGWIDLKRFGVAASCDAAKIVETGGDRELLAAAVSRMEKDLKNSDEGKACYEEAVKALGESR